MGQLEDAIEQLPREYQPEKTRLKSVLRFLPLTAFRARDMYAGRIRHGLSAWKIADGISHLEGTIFELSRIGLLQKVGIPVDYNLQPIRVQCRCLKQGVQIPPTGIVPEDAEYHVVNQRIEPDVPFEGFNGLPHVYEVKWLPFMPWGKGYRDWNQAFKYAEAARQNFVGGVTFEISGLLSPGLLEYVLSTPLPKVQFIYSFPLPSGKEWRVEFKKSKQGVLIHNRAINHEDAAIATAMEAVAQQPGARRRLVSMFAEFQPPTDRLITRSDLEDYHRGFHDALWKRLLKF